ncbi:hypothetical protein Acy02nite_02760 [Actinoplanes cyaneus]|uniref:Uncharacterized protein n=1 Tax=Actinoplanes cyaneus TaxID=52696 RepID=A0A919II93_9ACTN|nr:hypothetical protein [Actinoplanes cyaneus]MCW2143519.1 hypothetical protein [Actinoplanes cyaneus]GID62395.1 hypothetical protein Acy02nite_02760 [Actinoplanes cyaneus]
MLVARRAQNVVPVDELRVHTRFVLARGATATVVLDPIRRELATAGERLYAIEVLPQAALDPGRRMVAVVRVHRGLTLS